MTNESRAPLGTSPAQHVNDGEIYTPQYRCVNCREWYPCETWPTPVCNGKPKDGVAGLLHALGHTDVKGVEFPAPLGTSLPETADEKAYFSHADKALAEIFAASKEKFGCDIDHSLTVVWNFEGDEIHRKARNCPDCGEKL